MFRKRRGGAGHTLVEMVVSAALIGICLTGILALVKAGTRYLLVTNAKQDMQREALLLIRTFAEEFAETNDASFAVGNGVSTTNVGVVFASPRSPVNGNIAYDDFGRLFWPKYVCYYVGNEVSTGLKVVNRVVAHIPNPPPFPPGAPPIDDFLAQPFVPTVVARNVSAFNVTKAASAAEVVVRLELPSGYGRKYGFEVKTMIFTRN